MARTEQTKSTGGNTTRKQLSTKTRSDQKSIELNMKNIKISPAPGNWQNLPKKKRDIKIFKNADKYARAGM